MLTTRPITRAAKSPAAPQRTIAYNGLEGKSRRLCHGRNLSGRSPPAPGATDPATGDGGEEAIGPFTA
jgi:hypothetical protein